MFSFSWKNLSLDSFVLIDIFFCSIPTLYYSYYSKEFTESRILYYNAEFEENLDLTADMFNIYIWAAWFTPVSMAIRQRFYVKPPGSMAKPRLLDVYSSTINCLKLCCCRYATVLQPLPAFYMGWILNIFLTFPLSGTMERIAHTPGELFEVACKWHVARKTVCCTSVAQCISIHNSCMRQHVLPSCRCPGCGGVLGQAMNPSPTM